RRLFSLLPATTRAASVRRSRRRPAMRVLASGPWHWKQLSERMGRISRWKSTGAARRAAVAARVATMARWRIPGSICPGGELGWLRRRKRLRHHCARRSGQEIDRVLLHLGGGAQDFGIGGEFEAGLDEVRLAVERGLGGLLHLLPRGLHSAESDRGDVH